MQTTFLNMKAIYTALVLGILPVMSAFPQDRSSTAKSESSLLPTAFAKNPRVRFNVITDVTDAGKKVAKPSSKNPAYYAIRPAGYVKFGEAAQRDQAYPPVQLLVDSMRDALAANGYVAASDVSDPVSLIIVFNWGSFSGATLSDGTVGSEDSDAMLDIVLQDSAKMEELLDRASLVGGNRFAEKMAKALRDEVGFWQAAASGQRLIDFQRSIGSGGSDFMKPPLGRETRPIRRFKTRNSYLFERAFHSFYFVVATAYDQVAAAEGERVLLWETKMTVDSNGIALGESLRPLIASAAPYFGREMDETKRISARIDRVGSVEVGPIEVIEVIEPEE